MAREAPFVLEEVAFTTYFSTGLDLLTGPVPRPILEKTEIYCKLSQQVGAWGWMCQLWEIGEAEIFDAEFAA